MITRLENRVTLAVRCGYVLAAATVVLGLVVASDDAPRAHGAEGLAISAIGLMLAIVVGLLGFLARYVVSRMEDQGA